MVRRISAVTLWILFWGIWWGNTFAAAVTEPCPCSSLSPPQGYYVTVSTPVWVSGKPFVTDHSIATIAETHLMPLDVLKHIADSFEKVGEKTITLADVLSGKYVVVRLYLYPAARTLSASGLRVYLETSAVKQILPTHSTTLLPKGSSFLTMYLLVTKAQILGPEPSWIRVYLLGPQGEGYFQFRS